jgi:NTP pyrophosphatase (non-canonical NTP hydrolase)
MTFDEYQKKAAVYMLPQCRNKEYLSLGLAGEAGEFCDKIKKIIRGDQQIDDSLLYELSDIVWYCSQLASILNVPFDKIAQMNLDKLQDRLERNKIKGSGDKR